MFLGNPNAHVLDSAVFFVQVLTGPEYRNPEPNLPMYGTSRAPFQGLHQRAFALLWHQWIHEGRFRERLGVGVLVRNNVFVPEPDLQALYPSTPNLTQIRTADGWQVQMTGADSSDTAVQTRDTFDLSLVRVTPTRYPRD